MPVLEIDGVGRVEVDDTFLKLSPSDQQKTVDEIKASLAVPRQEAQAPTPIDRVGEAFQAVADIPAPKASRLTAVARGANQGATGNFSDEIAAAQSTLPAWMTVAMPGAATIAGAVKSWVDPATGQASAEALAKERLKNTLTRKAHPVSSLVGEVAGAAAMPVGVAARVPGLLARVAAGARSGAPIGLAGGVGAGEGLEDRLTRGLTGLGIGTVGGAAAPVAVAGVQQLGRGGRALYDQVAAPIRGAFNPDSEVARRIGTAMQADNAMPQPMLSPADEAAAVARGQPILNVDRGGETVRALARSAANTSPQGRAVLENTISDRFGAQGDRTTEVIRRIAGPATSAQRREQLEQLARAANRPAYNRAYQAPGAQDIWDEGLEQLAGAPVVQDAIRQATVTGRNATALAGFPPIRNPFRIDPQTRGMSLATDDQGNRVLPSLQFWDHVKRNLDAVGTREARQAARVLRDHLDELVPEYRDARAGAARFFGAGDALEAGEQLVNSRMGNDEARKAIARLNPGEKQLLAEGFADRLVRQISEVPDRRNVINSTFIRSKASRERIEMVLGPQKARELEAFLRVEDLLDRARTAVSGNSTTARQLAEMGIAGGAAGYGYYTGDLNTSAGILSVLLAKKGLARVDRGVAQRVAEALASPDPDVIQRGLRMVANNGTLMAALRSLDLPAARGTAAALN